MGWREGAHLMTKTEQQIEELETINREQLVTATDRLLFSGTPRRFARGSIQNIQSIRMPTRLDDTQMTARRNAAKRRSRFAGLTCFISLTLVAVGLCATIWPM